jgi:hypothetical protein
MVDVDLGDGVAVRLAPECLDDGGRLRDYDIWDTAARGALLVDLVCAGRLTDDEESITLDPAPIGFSPADRLLAAMEVEPERPLTWWMDHGDVRMEDVADAAVDAGRWLVVGGLLDRRFDHRGADRPGFADGGCEEDAVVTALVTACGAELRRPKPVPEEELTRTGTLRWICEAVTAHLEEVHRRNLRAAGSADGGGGSPYW